MTLGRDDGLMVLEESGRVGAEVEGRVDDKPCGRPFAEARAPFESRRSGLIGCRLTRPVCSMDSGSDSSRGDSGEELVLR